MRCKWLNMRRLVSVNCFYMVLDVGEEMELKQFDHRASRSNFGLCCQMFKEGMPPKPWSQPWGVLCLDCLPECCIRSWTGGARQASDQRSLTLMYELCKGHCQGCWSWKTSMAVPASPLLTRVYSAGIGLNRIYGFADLRWRQFPAVLVCWMKSVWRFVMGDERGNQTNGRAGFYFLAHNTFPLCGFSMD